MLPGPAGWAGTKLLFYFGRHSFGSFQYSRLASSPASYIPNTTQAMAPGKLVCYLLVLPPRDSGTPLLLDEQRSKGVFAEDTPAEYLPSASKHWL